MTFARCLDCGDTFQHAQTARHALEKHPYAYPVHHTVGEPEPEPTSDE